MNQKKNLERRQKKREEIQTDMFDVRTENERSPSEKTTFAATCLHEKKDTSNNSDANISGYKPISNKAVCVLDRSPLLQQLFIQQFALDVGPAHFYPCIGALDLVTYMARV